MHSTSPPRTRVPTGLHARMKQARLIHMFHRTRVPTGLHARNKQARLTHMSQGRGWWCILSLSHIQLFEIPWTVACQSPLSFTISWSLFKLMFIESVLPSNHLILCCPLSSFMQSFSASGSFPASQLFALGGQSIGDSASASVLPMNIQG